MAVTATPAGCARCQLATITAASTATITNNATAASVNRFDA